MNYYYISCFQKEKSKLFFFSQVLIAEYDIFSVTFVVKHPKDTPMALMCSANMRNIVILHLENDITLSPLYQEIVCKRSKGSNHNTKWYLPKGLPLGTLPLKGCRIYILGESCSAYKPVS